MSKEIPDVQRTDDGRSTFRITCAVCGAPLHAWQKSYCSYECRRKGNYLMNMKTQAEAKKRLRSLLDPPKVEKKLGCKGCVWKSGNTCVMPTCFKAKGIGYGGSDAERDTPAPAVGDTSGHGIAFEF